MSKISLNKYSLTDNHCILFDTNILINLFYPLMNTSNYMRDYQLLWGKILKSKAKLILPAIQISEFINRCIRFQYALYKTDISSELDFKRDYRNTDDYRNKMKDILDIVKNDILTHFSVINDDFNNIDPEKLYIYGFSYDFNDAMLVGIAENNNADIITHDSDFANYNTKINLVSSNHALLMFS